MPLMPPQSFLSMFDNNIYGENPGGRESMDQVLKKQVPLEIGTLDLQVTLKFIPNGEQQSALKYGNNPINVTTPSTTSGIPATEKQKQALAGMARRLGRQVDLEKLTKFEASNMIDEFGAELRRR